MKAHSNNDKTLDELGMFVSSLRASSLKSGGTGAPPGDPARRLVC